MLRYPSASDLSPSAPCRLRTRRRAFLASGLIGMLLAAPVAARTSIDRSGPLTAVTIAADPPPATVDIVSPSADVQPAKANALRVLRRPPFPPTDVNLFSNRTYPAGTSMAPAPETVIDERALRRQVKRVLCKRFGCNSAATREGLALMDDPTIKAKVPDARLRASLAMLKGTPQESSIEALKSDAVSSVEFGQPPGGDLKAQGMIDENGKAKVIINEKYQFEDLRALAPIMGHEGLHVNDRKNSNKEELVANVLEALTYGQFVSEDPPLASQGTELTRIQNTWLTGLLNTRTPGGRVNLTSGQGQMFPGGSLTETSFAEIFTSPNPADNVDTLGNPALLSAIRKVTGQPVASANFDQATIDLLDENINLFRAARWVKIAKALKLGLNP